MLNDVLRFTYFQFQAPAETNSNSN